MSRRLDDVRLAVMMIDGLELQGRTNVVALGITTEGVKIPLGLWEGSTENATVATALLSRPGRARPRPRAGDPVRDRRRQGAAQGDPQRLRRGAGAELCAAQGAQRDRPPARARPAGGEAAAAQGVGARRSRPRARPAARARRRARPQLPRRRRLAARRHGRDAHAHPARRHAAT